VKARCFLWNCILLKPDKLLLKAYSILKQFKRHEETGTAVFKRNGRMIDLPMVIAALRVYQRAARIELKSVKRKANGTRKI